MSAIRAPAEDGAMLAVPPLERAGELIAENHERLSRVSGELLGRPWQDVRRLARKELLESATGYTKPARSPIEGAALLLAGHQPELFHPGVWVKNFALAGLARAHRAVAVNLLVDNDAIKSTSLLLPARGDPWPEPRPLAFDRWQGETPWEERNVLDRDAFDRFGDDASAIMRHWGVEPLLPAFWADVRRQLDARGLLGESFAAARRNLEVSWGCANLELPLSQVCRGEAFARLAGTLLLDLPRFFAVYNASVRDHRKRHGIRSRHHPVPDLVAAGEWLEAPFWGWKPDRPRRAHLFARLRADRVELRAGDQPWPSLPSPSAPHFLDAWLGLERDGYKVRSRALTTTLFSRLFLADLFVHGIGGGKYDELTDVILNRFWGVAPPAFLVLSATRLLPLPTFPATAEQRRALAHRVRDLHFNPQRHLAANEVADEKQAWIRRKPATRAGRRERFRELRRLSDALRPEVADQIADGERRLVLAEREARANALLRRRDYAFCLFPEATLRPFCERFL